MRQLISIILNIINDYFEFKVVSQILHNQGPSDQLPKVHLRERPIEVMDTLHARQVPPKDRSISILHNALA